MLQVRSRFAVNDLKSVPVVYSNELSMYNSQNSLYSH